MDCLTATPDEIIIHYLENNKNLKNITSVKITSMRVGEYHTTQLMFEQIIDRDITAQIRIQITTPDGKRKTVVRTITTTEIADPILSGALFQKSHTN